MPRPSHRMLIGLALACGALAAVGAGLRWAQFRAADAALAALARELAPWGRLTWGERFATLDGRFGAHGLVLEGPTTRLTARSLTLDPGGPWPALRFALAGDDGPPTALRVAITALELPTAAPTTTTAIGLESLDVAPCGGQDGGAVLRAVHGGPLRVDLALGWRWDSTARHLALDAALEARELVTIELDLEVEALAASARLTELARARPIARRGTLTIIERGWYEASAAHCAAASGLAPAAWLDAHAAAVVELLATTGVAPAPSLVEGWRGFRAAPRRWRVAFDNAALHGATELAAREPAEIAALIGLEVEFNEMAVTDPRFELSGAQRLAAAPPLADAPTGAEALLEPAVRTLFGPVPASPPAAAAPQARAPARRSASAALPGMTTLTPRDQPPPAGIALRWEALPQARGRPVWVVMRDGRTLAGTLRDATRWRLTLEQRLHGGSVVMPLDRDAIARVIAER